MLELTGLQIRASGKVRKYDSQGNHIEDVEIKERILSREEVEELYANDDSWKKLIDGQIHLRQQSANESK